MLSPETIAHGQHVMAVCNACRYCEGYCPVFPAMENRITFAKSDLAYLANLCHNCGECLYACPYAPPHEFGIDVPRTLAEIRLGSYEEYCWPASLSTAFRRNSLNMASAIVGGSSAVVLALALVSGANVWPANPSGDFYRIVPHHLMVAVFAIVALLVLFALAVGCVRFWRSNPAILQSRNSAIASGFRDAVTLRHLHGSGTDCTDAAEDRSPWRRWFHHLTFYGFLLCFTSTSVAALYHVVFGWRAPYGYASLPVVLGTVGGAGLLVGPAGLFALRRRRDRALVDPAQDGLDQSFIMMLFMTSATGLLLLALRGQPVMAVLLVVHLGFVLGLFLTLPYGKFVHGIYRTAALIVYARERRG